MTDSANTPPAKQKQCSLTYLIIAGALVLALFSLAPYMPVSTVATDLPSHFVLQYFIGSIVLAIITLVDKYPKWVFGVAVFAFVLNLLQLWPQTPFGTPPMVAGAPLKILQTNVLFLNSDVESLKAMIAVEKPDLIVAEEVTPAFETMFGTLKADYPNQTIWAEEHDARGLAVLSKDPLDRMERHDFDAQKPVPTMVFALKHDGQEITFVSVHPPTPNVSLQTRDNIFNGIADMFKDRAFPLVVLGDFNATPYSPALQRLTNALQLTNARRGRGINGTWPTALPAFLRLPIDNALLFDTIGVVDYHLGPDIGSDHLPSVITIAFKEKRKDAPQP